MPPGAHAPPVGPGQYPPPDMAARIAAIQARAHHVSQSSDAAAAVMAAQHQAAHAVYGPPIVSTNQPSAMASAPTAGGSSSRSSKPRYKKRTKKYNNFNIFFMLERQLLLQSRGGGIDAVKSPIDVSKAPLSKHKELHLPPLCRRYNHLPLTANWFLELLANQNKKRPHRKSHGLIPFKELAQTVAKNYREIDEETQEFVNEVAERLGWHCEEHEAAEEKERKEMEARLGIPHGGSGGYGKKRKTEAPIVSKGTKDLSHEEAATVHNLMGMKTTSSPPYGMMNPHGMSGYPMGGVPHPGLAHLYPPPPHMPSGGGHGGHHQHHPHHQFPPHPSGGGGGGGQQSSSSGPGGSGENVESDRLQLELASAMSARVESERRIELLRAQMMNHNARQGGGPGDSQTPSYPPAPAASHQARPSSRSSYPPAGGYEQYLSQLKMESPSPLPARGPAPPAGLDFEKELLKEALMRRMPGVGGAPGGAPSQDSFLTNYLNQQHGGGSEAERAEKRRRYSEEAVARSGSREPSGTDYNDLYSKLAARSALGSRDPLMAAATTRDPSKAAAEAARDMAYLDSLAHHHRGPAPAPANSSYGQYPPQYPPAPRDYQALLSQLGPPRPSPAAAAPAPNPKAPTPPPAAAASANPAKAPTSPSGKDQAKQELLEMVRGASKKSQFGLSYNDIMDVWKEMKKDGDEEGDGGDKGASKPSGSDGKKKDKEESRGTVV